MWVRLILENSTVCLISRRISLLCPVDVNFCLSGLWVGGCWCRGFFDNDSGEVLFFGRGSQIASFVQSWMWLLLIVLLVCCFGGGLVGMFSMESLILAQDERWRRA
jgi:hypothetical protein